MHVDSLQPTVQLGLAGYYGVVTLLNLGFVWFCRQRNDRTSALIWSVVAGVFFAHGIVYLFQAGWVIPYSLRRAMNDMVTPTSYFLASILALALFVRFRKQVTEPQVAWGFFNASLLFFGWALTDDHLRNIVSMPDNVPIVILMFSMGFFTWLAFRKAIDNDDRLARGEPPAEKLEEQKVLVWPDLVYTELIAMIVVTCSLVIWAIFLKAPLEQPASATQAPFTMKAPWYFLGLQEMLVYFDPWMAGVVLPSLIIVGLIAIPYIDFNKKGNGYYTFSERRFAISSFLFGFLILWVMLIVLGVFLRGPNWVYFGPFEKWDAHKAEAMTNVNLSDYFWLSGLGQSVEGKNWLIRELPGIFILLAYFLLIPPILAKTIFRRFFVKMGFVRYFILVTLLQFMALLPIKMLLRWTLNLKYIVYIPEWFFNI